MKDRGVWSDFDPYDCDYDCHNCRDLFYNTHHNPQNHYHQHMMDATAWCTALIMGRLQFRPDPNKLSKPPIFISDGILEVSGTRSMTITVIVNEI